MKVLAFTFKIYISTLTNKVLAAHMCGSTQIILTAPPRLGLLTSSYYSFHVSRTPLPQVDLLIVVTSALLLLLDTAQLSAIKVGPSAECCGINMDDSRNLADAQSHAHTL